MITIEMMDEFNKILFETGSALRVLPDKSYDGTFNIRLTEEPYIDEENRKAFPNDYFYSFLELHLSSNGISKVHYNNTKLSFWTR